jgi:hypothetical protein
VRSAFALALTLAGCGGKATAPPAGPPPDLTVVGGDSVPVHRDATCSSIMATVDREQELVGRNQAALVRALTDANLRDPGYPVDSFRGQGSDWEVVEGTPRTLLSPSISDRCGAGNPWRLAVDGRGQVFALNLQRRTIARHELRVCGCATDVPFTCGGAPSLGRWRWTLPSDVRFAGPLSVVVDDESYERVFDGRADGTPCPRMIPPP